MKLLVRVAFICNLLFLFCLVMQRMPDFKGIKPLNEYIIILGWMVSPFINLFANGLYWIGKLFKKEPVLPLWLVIVNLLFLLVQIYVYFILPT